MNSKYTMALPLYRQEQELHRRGLSISRQTMSTIAQRGTCEPTTLGKIAKALGVDPADLIKED